MSTDHQPLILAVDDSERNLEILADLLKDDFAVVMAMNGEMALDMAAWTLPDLILLDVKLPDIDGYEVCEKLKRSGLTGNIPVILITAACDETDEARGLELGAADFIIKPFVPARVKSRVNDQMELMRYRDRLKKLLHERTREPSCTQEASVENMGALAAETGGHIRRTRGYVRLLAEGLAGHPAYAATLDFETIDLLHKSAPLHDIGNVGIPDAILFKQGRLEPGEYKVMRRHPMLGGQALAAEEKKLGANAFLHLAGEIVASHHERWDGSGYPFGLEGADIPLSGRLMAVADVYDALISRRVYKAPLTHSTAVDCIREDSGRGFDPDVVAMFLELREEFREVALEYADFLDERIALAR